MYDSAYFLLIKIVFLNNYVMCIMGAFKIRFYAPNNTLCVIGCNSKLLFHIQDTNLNKHMRENKKHERRYKCNKCKECNVKCAEM